MIIVPLTLREANAYVAQHHRHSNACRGMKFAIGASHENAIVGVAIVGRPVTRHLDDTWTLEVLRVTTTGHPNACSFLYGACWRAARTLGYRRLVTYTLKSEPGTSLKASGWRIVGEVKADGWNRPGRPRVDKHELQERFRWEVSA